MLDNILHIWSRRKWWLLAGFLLAITTSASLIYALPDLYRGSTTVLIGQDAIAGSFVTSDNGNRLDQRLHMIRQDLLSRDQLLVLIGQHDLYPELRESVPTEALLARMRNDIHLSQSTTSQVSLQRGLSAPMEVRISYQGWSAEQAAEITNALADIYRERYENIRFDQASKTTEFLRVQLEGVEQRMIAQENDIDAFRNKHLGQLPQQESMNLATLERLNSDLRLNRERQVLLLNRRSEAQASGFGAVVSVAGESRLDRLQRELIVMGARYNESHPGIIRLRREIRSLQAETIESEGFTDRVPEISVGEEIRRLDSEETSLRNAIDSLLQRLQTTPEIGQTLSQMSNAYNTIREEHLALQRRYQEARLAESLESQQTQQFQVLERALPPDFASAPNRPRLLIMVVVLTLGALAALTFIAEQLDQSFYSTRDVRTFTSVPVITSLRRIRSTGETVRRALTAMTILVIFTISVLLLSAFAYSSGQTAKGLVWIVAGNNA